MVLKSIQLLGLVVTQLWNALQIVQISEEIS